MACLKKSTKPRETLRRRIQLAAQQLDLPEGMLAGQPQLTLDGKAQLLIEQHKGLLEYGEQEIRISARGMVIQVQGNHLYLAAMDQDAIRIRGTILGVRYLEQE